MKGKKHTAEQIIRKLREADAMLAAGKSVGQVCQALEVREQTFHRWRNQYGGMKAEKAKRHQYFYEAGPSSGNLKLMSSLFYPSCHALYGYVRGLI